MAHRLHPASGLTSGISILALGIAVVLYVKNIIPEEISVQRRTTDPPPGDRRTSPRCSTTPGRPLTLGRRKACGLLGGAGILFGLVVVAPLGA